jgi:hypothetical protein
MSPASRKASNTSNDIYIDIDRSGVCVINHIM